MQSVTSVVAFFRAGWWTDALQQRSLYKCALKVNILVGVGVTLAGRWTDALQQRSQYQCALKILVESKVQKIWMLSFTGRLML